MVLLSVFSLEQLEAIIESAGYYHFNEALKWDNHDFLVVPKSHDPWCLIIIAIFIIHLLKDQWKNESLFFYFFPCHGI